MTTESVTLQIPKPMFERLQARAKLSQRSLEAELLNALAEAFGSSDALSPEVAAEIAAIELLDDTTLWRIARSQFSKTDAAELTRLSEKAQREGLTSTELARQIALVKEYEAAMARRATAAASLQARGHKVNGLLRRK